MEYFINVYVLKNATGTIYTEAFYKREDAVMDVQDEEQQQSTKYIHSIRVEDDEAVIVDLRGE